MGIEIKINGESFPCYPTMGAMLRFKKEIGKEVTDIQENSFSDMVTYLWCCVKSASSHEGKKFDLSLMDFADSLSPDYLTDWATKVKGSADAAEDVPEETDTEKKS